MSPQSCRGCRVGAGLRRGLVRARSVLGRAAGPALAAVLLAPPAWSAETLSQEAAADWLQKVSEAPRRLSYEGVFVYRHGESMQTYQITNRVSAAGKESRLVALDGSHREVLCTQGGSVSLSSDGGEKRLERRLSSRHFPDLFPPNAERLNAWYTVKLGEITRVAGLDCREVVLVPKDQYRWGHVLCSEKETGLPLKAAMVNERGQPLMQYAFTEVQIGPAARTAALPRMPAAPALQPIENGALALKALPPGYARVIAVKRKLPNRPEDVEHWVFSDGLTHISLFIEPAAKRVETVKGESQRGMVNMLTRQVGSRQVTVIGEAPWPAVEAIAMSVVERP